MYGAAPDVARFSLPTSKSAFLPADDIVTNEGLEISGLPKADMRRRLSHTIGLKADEVLQMRKPSFGDVRATKPWHTPSKNELPSLKNLAPPFEHG